MKPLSLIAAKSRNGFIGKGGQLPWHIPEDLRYFKNHTKGHAVIMGRKTFDEVGKPLPLRTNIVITRDASFSAEGCIIVHSIEDALTAVDPSDEEPFVIGGAEIYRMALPYVTRIYLTEVDRDVEGDVRFPSLEGHEFKEISRREGEAPGVTFVVLERK